MWRGWSIRIGPTSMTSGVGVPPTRRSATRIRASSSLAPYVRAWHTEEFAATFGGGAITNPGRYLVLLPPINGATATSGMDYFPEVPGKKWVSWDTQLTFDYMPSQFFTLRGEFTYRHASVPYFSGPGGITPPGGNPGNPGSLVKDMNGNVIWRPDLVQDEPRFTLALMVKL
ncbi:MAG TPA: hypothetical protein VHW23_44545 [Kofleriaceae bacterium]|nr:hypothetical protein [Kofleriaceae bacterium]